MREILEKVIGGFYVALGIRYVWSVGEARENLGRKGIFRFPKDWNAQGKNSVFIAVAVVFLVVQPVHGFQIWFLDVGQGDGVFLRTQDEAILSDCGSSQDKKIGKNVLGPFLKSQGIRTLDWILVSHADADHTNGIEWLLKEEADIRVRNLALPAAGKGQEAYKKMETLARKRGAEVYYLHRGETVRAKSLALRCLYPEAGEKPAEERNSHSLVFDVTYGKFSMLLTGDIGVEEEREILGMEEDKKGEKGDTVKSCTPWFERFFLRGVFGVLFPSFHGALLWRGKYLRASGAGGGGTSGTDGDGDLENGGFGGGECVDGRETYVYQGI